LQQERFLHRSGWAGIRAPVRRRPGGWAGVYRALGAVSDDAADLPLDLRQVGSGTYDASDSVHYAFPSGVDISVNVDMPGASSCQVMVALEGYLEPVS
jgi:hypothetical protein